jgi:hypothetical protein
MFCGIRQIADKAETLVGTFHHTPKLSFVWERPTIELLKVGPMIFEHPLMKMKQRCGQVQGSPEVA